MMIMKIRIWINEAAQPVPIAVTSWMRLVLFCFWPPALVISVLILVSDMAMIAAI